MYYRLFYELQSIFFSHGNYVQTVERIMLCSKENSVQIARLVIFGADQRSCLRCQRLQLFTKHFGEYRYTLYISLVYKTNCRA